MMIIRSIRTPNMQCDACGLRKTLQAVRNHFRAEVADLFALEAQINDCVGPVGEVDDGPGEGFVERGVAAAEAGEGCACAEGFCECCSEAEHGVFGGVMVVNYKISLLLSIVDAH